MILFNLITLSLFLISVKLELTDSHIPANPTFAKLANKQGHFSTNE
jgi:hypothetical protein